MDRDLRYMFSWDRYNGRARRTYVVYRFRRRAKERYVRKQTLKRLFPNMITAESVMFNYRYAVINLGARSIVITRRPGSDSKRWRVKIGGEKKRSSWLTAAELQATITTYILTTKETE